MHEVMKGTRVLEVASWTFVPAAGAVLADWGADVIKIEHPVSGDPQRGLASMGVIPGGAQGVNFMIEVPNRGKRSVGIDMSTEEGRELIYELAEVSDVFLTNFLPDVRGRLQIDVEHIRARNPNIIYARGHGQGTKGPDSRRGGFDGASYWSRGGVGDALTPPGSDYPVSLRAAFGDVMGGLTVAGGIAAALYARERTGEAPTVDVSLLGTAMWNIQPDIVMTGVLGLDDVVRYGDRAQMPNPLVGNYRTKDDRWLFLNMMQSDRFFPDLMLKMGLGEFVDDARFADAASRAQHRVELVALLDQTFATRTLDEWREELRHTKGVWEPVQRATELRSDVQVQANGYLQPVADANGNEFSLVPAPVQFDETPPHLRAAPAHGADTDAVLTDVLGLPYDQVLELKLSGAVL